MNQRTKLASALLAFAVVLSPSAWAQETHPSKSEGSQTVQDLSPHNSAQALSAESNRFGPERYFRLTFRVLNLSPVDKIVDSRSYVETIPTGREGYEVSIIRTGDRVPVATGAYQTGKDSAAVNTQFQYVDAGTDIEVQRAKILDQALTLKVTASISTFSSSNAYIPANMKQPIIRNIRWVSWVTIPINKPTIIFTSDNNADKGKTELELTAVPINQ